MLHGSGEHLPLHVPVHPVHGIGPVPSARILSLALSALALAAAGIAAARAPAPTIDPDLVRVIRCMALIKGGLALAALGASSWRLGRPAATWRRGFYVAAPALMIGGSVTLWSMQHVGAGALGLHLGLFAWIAAALTDPDFFSGWVHRRRI